MHSTVACGLCGDAFTQYNPVLKRKAGHTKSLVGLQHVHVLQIGEASYIRRWVICGQVTAKPLVDLARVKSFSMADATGNHCKLLTIHDFQGELALSKHTTRISRNSERRVQGPLEIQQAALGTTRQVQENMPQTCKTARPLRIRAVSGASSKELSPPSWKRATVFLLDSSQGHKGIITTKQIFGP